MPLDLLGKSMALLCAFTWATAVIFFKLAGDNIRPLALNLYKTTLTVAILFPLLPLLGVPLLPATIGPRQALAVAASGILGIAVADTMFFACLNRLGAATTAIVDALYVPFVMTASWLALGEQPRLEQVGGAVLVIAAILVAAYRRNGGGRPTGHRLAGFLFGIGAMALMAASIVLMRPVLEKVHVFWVTEVRMLSALLVLSTMFALQKGRRGLLAPLWRKGSRGYAFRGALLGNLISMTLWIAAFKFTTVNSAAILNQTNTVLGVVLAALFLKEPFDLRRVLATLLAVAGTVLILVG